MHSVVFSAFSADSLKARIEDCKAKILVTSDGYYRRGEKENLIEKAEEAAKGTSVKKIIVARRLGEKINEKFLDFNNEIEKADKECNPEEMNSEDIMFILYTSGTTGKPKGIVHDTGGYAVQAYWTAKWNFNLRESSIMWCTADVGWITGHSYAFYGPLLNGSATLIYEGSPDFPDFGRWWKIIQDNKVTVFYTAPTAIRMFMKSGEEWIKKYNLGSLEILGTVGEPIDEEAWMWYLNKIGKGRCPVIDTWWQTETGGTLINSLPGIGPFIPVIAGKSFPGTRHIVVDDNGKEVKPGELGNLVQASPFAPGMLHGVYNNHEKYVETYWRFKKYYDTSDGAYEKDGLIRVTGRTDDVMKVAGHRLSTAELENALNESEKVNESAVVPVSDEIKGQVPAAFVVLEKNIIASDELEKELKKHVDKKIGPTARPAKIYFVEDLPKTRSGKIMRRILKALLNNEDPGNLMTLINPGCVDKIKEIISIPKKHAE
jgi:acetyl-CoA synthetase